MTSKLDRVRRAQPLSELLRKAMKASRKKQKIWTAEELDWARAEGKRRALKFSNCFGAYQ